MKCPGYIAANFGENLACGIRGERGYGERSLTLPLSRGAPSCVALHGTAGRHVADAEMRGHRFAPSIVESTQ